MSNAGLTNGAFYAHFASKEDLVGNVLADQLQLPRALTGRDLSDQLLARGAQTALALLDDGASNAGVTREPRCALAASSARLSPRRSRVGYRCSFAARLCWPYQAVVSTYMDPVRAGMPEDP
jgi:AcrR family transcriptional regulator